MVGPYKGNRDYIPCRTEESEPFQQLGSFLDTTRSSAIIMLFENVSSRYLWLMTDYQPKYNWHRTQLDENDPPRDTDWMGMDGNLPIGRIRKELHGPVKNQWQWAAWYPKTHKGRPPMPNLGYCATARIATQKVEEYWELAHRVMEPR